MATKVKPCRIKATGTPQVGYVPKYVDEDTFQWGAGGGGGGSDIVYATQAEYNALLPGAASDGKHYFIYSTSGGGGWQPGVNTLVYLPLKGDAIDQTGNYTFTNSNVTIGSDYATFNGNGVLLSDSNFGLTGNTSKTVVNWVNPQSSSLMIGVGWGGRGQGTKFGYYIDNYEVVIWANGGIYDVRTSVTLTSNTWASLIITYDGTTITVYKDGTQVYSGNKSFNTGSGKFSIGRANDSSQYYFTGEMGATIVEDKVRTATEISDYYNQTKGDYGIS